MERLYLTQEWSEVIEIEINYDHHEHLQKTSFTWRMATYSTPNSCVLSKLHWVLDSLAISECVMNVWMSECMHCQWYKRCEKTRWCHCHKTVLDCASCLFLQLCCSSMPHVEINFHPTNQRSGIKQNRNPVRPERRQEKTLTIFSHDPAQICGINSPSKWHVLYLLC